MSKKKEVLKFEAIIDDSGIIKIPEDVKKLIVNTYGNFIITLQSDLSSQIKSNNINNNELDTIAKNQGIPRDVAIEFFLCKGRISDNSFLTRIESHEE